MRLVLAITLLLTPGLALARGNSGGAFWVFLSLPLAGLIASGISAMFGRNGQVDLGAFLIGVFIAAPVVTAVGLWLAQEVTAVFLQATEGVPSWVVWGIVLAVIATIGRAIEYRDRKRKEHTSGNT
jgi:hypothetical protein